MGLLRVSQGHGVMERGGKGELTADECTQKGRPGTMAEVGPKKKQEVMERKGRKNIGTKRQSGRVGMRCRGSAETNGLAWRDRSQSIIFKQKQQAQENIYEVLI